MTATAPVPEPQSVKADTEYLVFAKGQAVAAETTGTPPTTVHAGTVWREVGRVTAKSAEAAVRKHAEANRPKDGEKLTLVAVAFARWTPISVSEVVKRELVIGT